MKLFFAFLSVLLLLSELKNLKTKTLKKTYLSIELSQENQSNPLYGALLSGNKSKLSFKQKKILLSFGLMHLFTPSGLHLSSLFFINFLPKSAYLILCISLLFILWPLGAYHSMIRVLLFKTLYCCQKKPDLRKTFLYTFFLSLCLGQFHSNPMSYLFSGAFWGILIFSQKNPVKIAFRLSLLNILINSMMAQSSHLLLPVINPILTALMVLIFPLLLGNGLLPNQIELNLAPGFNIFMNSLEGLSQYGSITWSFTNALIVFIIISRRRALTYTLCLLLSTSLNIEKDSLSSLYINLPPIQERLESKKKATKFIDRLCNYNLKCKLRNNNLGGFRF